MAETVVVTAPKGFDSGGNPTGGGSPVTLTPLEVAPGNTVLSLGVGGDLDDVEFTVYLPLRVKVGADWVATDTLVEDDASITVRTRECRARVQVWRSQRSATRGGVVVLCRSATGKAA